MKSIIIVLMMLGSVLASSFTIQTGQTKSYDADGNLVSYGHIKDDGYYRAGEARNYTKYLSTVTDTATGLEWIDIASSDTEISWADAITSCDDENWAKHLDWRVPTIKELHTLMNAANSYPSVTEDIFDNISSGTTYYWSSNVWSVNGSYKFIIEFGVGTISTLLDDNTHLKHVRCVRGAALTSPNLSRNATNNTVTDSTTQLQWQDDINASQGEATWAEAIDYCENTLTLGGYNDWRLPNKNELFSILDFSKSSPSIDDTVFQNHASVYYWSSTSRRRHSTYSWVVSFNHGWTYVKLKTEDYHVRCVRGGKLNIEMGFNPSTVMYLLD